jgi:hypothetical protein
MYVFDHKKNLFFGQMDRFFHLFILSETQTRQIYFCVPLFASAPVLWSPFVGLKQTNPQYQLLGNHIFFLHIHIITLKK